MNAPNYIGRCVGILLFAPLFAAAQTTQPELDLGDPLSALPNDPVETTPDALSPMPPVLSTAVAPAARDAYLRGERFLAAGDAAAALREFNLAIETDPTFAQAAVAQAKALAALGQNRSSVKALTAALATAKASPLRANIYLERGELYLELNLYQKALDDFDRAYELQPANPVAAHRRGQALRRLAVEELAAAIPSASDKMQQALIALDHALMLQPDFAEALSDRADVHADLGQTDEAVNDLTEALTLAADDNEMRHRLAILHLRRAASLAARNETERAAKRGDLQASINLLTDTLAMATDATSDEAPTEQDIRLARAVAHVEMAAQADAGAARREHYESALLDCQQVIETNPELSAAHFQHGVVLRLLDRYRPAVGAFTEALRLAPDNTEAHIRRGIAWYHLDELELALNDFHAVGVLPGDARPSFWMGVIHARRNDHVEAIRAYSEAIDENPRYRLAFSNRARSLARLGHWTRAIDDLNAMIQLNPDDAEAYHRRGIAQQQLGLLDAAERSFDQASQGVAN